MEHLNLKELHMSDIVAMRKLREPGLVKLQTI